MHLFLRSKGYGFIAYACFPLLLSLIFSSCGSVPARETPTPTTILPTEHAPVTLTMGSWRVDDVQQMNGILDQFHQKYPYITILYQTYETSDVLIYNNILESMLKQGTAPDIFYLTSYGFSRRIFNEGYLEPLSPLPGLKENFKPEVLAAWSADDGSPYGVPFIATSHAIYYNKDLFKKYNIEVPTSWDGLLAAASKLKANGTFAFANATGEEWPMAEIVFMNIAPTFTGGFAGRKAYLSGERCFNDAAMVSAFQAVKDISRYFPDNQRFLKYNDSLQLFLQGKAAMWLGGSWDIAYFEAQKPAFEWRVFAIPPPQNGKSAVTFHLDAGMGLNAASLHKKEALLFLEWMTEPEFGVLLGNQLPGFFPMHTQVPILNDQHANDFLILNEGRGTDIRFTWEKISDGNPDAYTLVMDGSIAVANGEQTPQQAADALQAGLGKWYDPAIKCKK